MTINISEAKVGIQGPQGTAGGLTTSIETSPAATALQAADGIVVVQSGSLALMAPDQVRGNAGTSQTNTAGTRWRIFDDFTTFLAANTTNATIVENTTAQSIITGAGAQITQKYLTEFIPGVASMETGTTSSGVGGAYVNGISILFFNTSYYRFSGRFKIPTLSDVTNQFEVRFGLASGFAAAPTNGFFFRAQHGDSTFEAVNMVASTPTVANTGVTIDTNYHVFDIEWTGTTCKYRIDGNLVATQAQKPADLSGILPGMGIFKAASTTSRAVYLDWWNCEITTGSRGIETIA